MSCKMDNKGISQANQSFGRTMREYERSMETRNIGNPLSIRERILKQNANSILNTSMKMN